MDLIVHGPAGDSIVRSPDRAPIDDPPRNPAPDGTRTLRELAADTARTARRRPSFGLYLVALATFPFNWLSPFGHAQAGWMDVFIAAAVVAWLIEGVRRRAVVRLGPPHYAYAAYVAAGVISAVFVAADRRVGAQDLLIVAELVALALLTGDYARGRPGRSAIAVVTERVALVASQRPSRSRRSRLWRRSASPRLR